MRVGTSRACNDLWHPYRDHPHACGDKLYKASAEIINPGSSPCVWGQAVPVFVTVLSLRIIPMRVGTSKCISTLTVRFWDHPHACGDKYLSEYLCLLRLGSSPCVWGQETSVLRSSQKRGIIPMRVGTRTAAHIRYTLQEDHPHACGDKIFFYSVKNCTL